MDKKIVRLLDQAVGKNADGTITLALETLKSKGVSQVNLNNARRIEKSFERGEPEDERATVAEIICAGWEVLRKMPHGATAEEHQQHKFIGELMLKSIEISNLGGDSEGMLSAKEIQEFAFTAPDDSDFRLSIFLSSPETHRGTRCHLR